MSRYQPTQEDIGKVFRLQGWVFYTQKPWYGRLTKVTEPNEAGSVGVAFEPLPGQSPECDCEQWAACDFDEDTWAVCEPSDVEEVPA